MSQAKMVALDPWITGDEAAGILKVKRRQIQKRAEQGFIEKKYLPKRPNERQGRVLYARADVDALLAGAPNHMEEAVAIAQFPEGPSGDGTKDLARIRAATPVRAAHRIIEDMLGEHAALARLVHPPPDAWQRYATKAFLTLDEAIEYFGLPRPEMERLLREGLVYSFGRGPKTWRIQRAALDAYGKAAHQ